MKNFLLKTCVKFAQKFIRKHPQKKRILIVSTTALGDTLWATAAIQNIRNSLPTCHLAVLTSPIGMEVLQNNPNINALFLFKNPIFLRFFSLVKQLYMQKFDTVLIFHTSQRLVLPLVSLIGAQRVIGTEKMNKGLDALLTEALPIVYQHEIQRRNEIAGKVGASDRVQTLSFHLREEELLLKREQGPWVLLHPGSKDPFKRWEEEKFIELGRKLQEDLSCKLLITGTEEEFELMQRIQERIPGAQIDQNSRSLREFAALLNKIDLLISNDTGPVHLACALNTPVIAIYTPTDPLLCGPHRAKRATVISRRATCTPCLKRKCQRPFCLMQIGADEVFQKAKETLWGC